MELIETFPATGSQIPLVTGKARRLPVAGFPYHVVYRHFTSVLQFKVEPKTAS
jgi:hypothetical protein